MDPTTLFHILNFANFSICTSMSIIAPFYPTYVAEQGVSSTLIGFIFSLHPFGGMIGSVIMGKKITSRNRLSYMIFAMLLQGTCLLFFILTYIVRDYYFIVSISIFSRILNGIAYAAVLCAFYSYIPFLFPDRAQNMIALAETASALGYGLGPLIGSLLYSLGGFTFPFVVCTLLSFYCGYQIHYIQNKQVEQIPEVEMYELSALTKNLNTTTEIEVQKPKQLMYLDALGHYSVLMTALMLTMVTTSFTLSFPILSQYLLKHFQKDSNSVGFYMSIGNLAYSLSTPIMIHLQNPNKPIIIQAGQTINGLGLFFQGPDKFFTGLDRNLTIFCISQFICYFSAAFTLIYSLPRMTEYLIQVFPKQDERCTIISSAIFSACISTGEFVGPLVAGFLNQYMEYDRIASLTGFAILLICLLYIPTLFK